MNLLEQTVDTALRQNPEYAALRPAVEKEILHHDILRIMNKAGYLKSLTFMGGTCLRACYASERLSEDLDFTGGLSFKKKDMAGLGALIRKSLEKKYELPVSVSEPEKETGNTDTWKIRIITKPERPDFPAQRINIDICMLVSYERTPAMIKNHYAVDMGTSGLIFYAESLKEILVDKIIALALRPNRVKNRDLWDIFWLSGRNVQMSKELLKKKLHDRKIKAADFTALYNQRMPQIKKGQKTFLAEMRRFLAPAAFTEEFTSPIWWEYLCALLKQAI